MNAYVIGTSRIIHSLSALFVVPEIMDLPRQGTPAVAPVVSCVASGLLLLASSHFEALATISVITTLIPCIFFCTAAWILVPERKSHQIALTGRLSAAAILILYFLL